MPERVTSHGDEGVAVTSGGNHTVDEKKKKEWS
jgi:hypothetical protein